MTITMSHKSHRPFKSLMHPFGLRRKASWAERLAQAGVTPRSERSLWEGSSAEGKTSKYSRPNFPNKDISILVIEEADEASQTESFAVRERERDLALSTSTRLSHPEDWDRLSDLFGIEESEKGEDRSSSSPTSSRPSSSSDDWDDSDDVSGMVGPSPDSSNTSIYGDHGQCSDGPDIENINIFNILEETKDRTFDTLSSISEEEVVPVDFSNLDPHRVPSPSSIRIDDLPFDVFDHILHFVNHEFRSIAHCSLVQRSWRPVAQRMIFDGVTIYVGRTRGAAYLSSSTSQRPSFDHDAFGLMISVTPAISTYITALEYDLPGLPDQSPDSISTSTSTSTSIKPVLGSSSPAGTLAFLTSWHLPQLSTLRLTNFPFLKDLREPGNRTALLHTARRTIPGISTADIQDIQLAGRFTTVTVLELSNIMLHTFRSVQCLLCALPALRSLTLTRAVWLELEMTNDEDKEFGPEPGLQDTLTPPTDIALRELHIYALSFQANGRGDGSCAGELLEWLITTSTMTSLRRFQVEGAERVSFLSKFLSAPLPEDIDVQVAYSNEC
jgi:hypothetical protein